MNTISINLASIDAGNHQVGQIYNAYSGAALIIVWLKEEKDDDDVGAAFEFVQDICCSNEE